MGSRRSFRRALALSLALVSGASCSGPDAPEPDRRPNLLWVSLDTLRADHLASYGYDRATSPHLDRLAAEGVLFERCVSTTSWTLPAHVSMLTGLPISAHGACDHRLWSEEARESATLRGHFVSETLSEAGWRTGGFYCWKYLEPQFGFGAGFDTWERVDRTFNSVPEVRAAWEAARASGDRAAQRGLVERHPDLFQAGRPSAGDAVDRALAWLGDVPAGADREPFFLFLHLFDAHDPYTPPSPFDARFDPTYDGPIDGRDVSSPDSPVVADMDPRDLEHLIALYDGEIAWLDAQLARLFAWLDASPERDNTLVIVTSDHGEEFFEHGRKLHRTGLYRESLEVPLILRMPGRLRAGARVAEPVSLVDLVPTVHALLDLPPPGDLPGLSIAEGLGVPLEGQPPTAARAWPRRTLFSELLFYDDIGDLHWLGSLYERDRQRIVLWPDSDRAQRFEIALTGSVRTDAEPRELPAGGPEAEAFDAELERVRAMLRRLRASSPTREISAEALDELDRAELHALGYSGFGGAPLGDADRLCLDGCVWRAR